MTSLLERPAPRVPAPRRTRWVPAQRRVVPSGPRARWVVVTDPVTGREHPELRWTASA